MKTDRFSVIRFIAFASAVVCLSVFSTAGFCQDDDDGGGNPPVDPGTGGIEIDAQGVLSSSIVRDNTGNLNRQRFAAAKAVLNKDMQQTSNLRKISLNRLEAQVAKYKAEGKEVPPEMKYMAGLTRITHVFYFPETKDIVIAGPAEGFFINSANRVVGMKSGKSVMQLEDMVVALRSFPANGKPTGMISCSIDPTQQGLQNMKVAVADVQRNMRPGDEARVVEYFKKALGLQTITIKGVSPKTHFARVMVEADYHMKLIGIGLERPEVRITSFIEKAKPSTVAKNSLQRWFFQPNYDYVRVSEDETAMQMVNGGVELVGEDERVSAQGNRTRTGGMNRASMNFCRSFTKMYDKLSDKNPLFAELRNCVDMSVAAAFIQEMDFYGQADWEMSTFADESKFPVEKYDAPRHVQPAVNAVWKGSFFMTPIGGGVSIHPRKAVSSENMKVDEKGTVMAAKNEINIQELDADQWWWD